VDRAGWDQQFLTDLRVLNLPGDLELHLALQHGDHLVCRVPEVLPALARLVLLRQRLTPLRSSRVLPG
jgi:hypothetical protein